jgi:hypothetical protein
MSRKSLANDFSPIELRTIARIVGVAISELRSGWPHFHANETILIPGNRLSSVAAQESANRKKEQQQSRQGAT